jgi:hypothetical protein
MTDLTRYRALAAAARAETSDGLTARERPASIVEELCDQVEKPTPPTHSEDQRKLLLDEIRETGGEWTGARAARFWWQRFHAQITPERGVQHLRKLQEAGYLVLTRPPRGRTFILNGGRQDPPRVEWATRMRWPSDGSEEIGHPIGESLARSRATDCPKLHVALLRRMVTYGPWVEVPVDAEAGDG